MIDYPKPLTKGCNKKIFEQMSNHFYKINKKKGNYEIGFFCYINYNNKKIPVLMSRNNIIDKKDTTINITINNNSVALNLGEIRYYSQKYDLSIIEIKDNKNINLNFFELDEILFQKNQEMYFYKESIYIMQFKNNDEKETLISHGIIDYIFKSEINLKCNIMFDSKTFPIFSSLNNKLIGITKNSNNNKGIILNFILKEFIFKYEAKNNFRIKKIIKKNKTKDTNEIRISIDIDENDIKKNIYFLDNYEYVDKKGIKHFHDNLNELNALNIELYIDKEKYEYKKYFVPEKPKIYDIKIKFNFTLKDCSFMFAGCEKCLICFITV